MPPHARSPSGRSTSRPLAVHRLGTVFTALACVTVAGYLALNQGDQRSVRTASELAVQGRYGEALAEAREVTRSPAAGRALLIRAQVAQVLGRHRAAIGLFRRVAERDPRSWFVHRDWAMSLMALGQRQAARERLEVASTLNPRLEPPPGF